MRKIKKVRILSMLMSMILLLSGLTIPVSAQNLAGVAKNVQWPNPGATHVTKEATPVLGEPGVWEIELKVQGKNIEQNTPTDVVLVLDRSASMTKGMWLCPKAHTHKEPACIYLTRGERVKEAANKFAETLLKDDQNINLAVVSFGGYYENSKPLIDASVDTGDYVRFSHRDTVVVDSSKLKENHFINDKGAAQKAINERSTVLGGATPLTASIQTADALLKKRPETHKKIIVLLTDGEATDNLSKPTETKKKAAKAAAKKAMDNGSDMYTIGAGLENNKDAQEVLKACQNKGYFLAEDSEGAVENVLNSIASEIVYGARKATVKDPMGEAFDLVLTAPEKGLKYEMRKNADLSGLDCVITQGKLNYDKTQDTLMWDIGNVTENQPAILKYKVSMIPGSEKGKEYPTNGNTVLDYIDANNQAAQKSSDNKDFTVPMVSSEGGNIRVIYYQVKQIDGKYEPINANGDKVTEPIFADQIKNFLYQDKTNNNSTILDLKDYTIEPEKIVTIEDGFYTYVEGILTDEQRKIQLTATKPTQTIYLPYLEQINTLEAKIIDYPEKLIYGEHFIEIKVPEKREQITRVTLTPLATPLGENVPPLEEGALQAKIFEGEALTKAIKVGTEADKENQTTYTFYSAPLAQGYKYSYAIEVVTKDKVEPDKLLVEPSTDKGSAAGIVPQKEEEVTIEIGKIDNFATMNKEGYNPAYKNDYYGKLRAIYGGNASVVKSKVVEGAKESVKDIKVMLDNGGSDRDTTFVGDELKLGYLVNGKSKPYENILEYTSYDGSSKSEGSYALEKGKKVTDIRLDTHVFMGESMNLSSELVRAVLVNEERQKLITWDASPQNNKMNTTNPVLQGDKSLLMPALVLEDMSEQVRTMKTGERKFLSQELALNVPKGLFSVPEFLVESMKEEYDFTGNIFIDPATGLSGGNIKLLFVDKTGFSQAGSNLTDEALKRSDLQKMALNHYIDIFENKVLNHTPQLKKVSVDYVMSALKQSEYKPPQVKPLEESEKRYTEITPQLDGKTELSFKVAFPGDLSELDKVEVILNFTDPPIGDDEEFITYSDISVKMGIDGKNENKPINPTDHSFELDNSIWNFVPDQDYIIHVSVNTNLNTGLKNTELAKDIKKAYYETYLKRTWASQGQMPVQGTDGKPINKQVGVTVRSQFNAVDDKGEPIVLSSELEEKLTIPYGAEPRVN